MNISSLLLARIQFTLSSSFFVFFMALTLGLSWLLFYFKARGRFSGNPIWIAAYRFWVRIFALSFVLTLASSVPVLFQLGYLWAGLWSKMGDIVGPLLGYAVLSIFIFKSCFLGVMLFGQHRVSENTHTIAVGMVALGQLIAIFWMLVLVSWMQVPTGASLLEGVYQVEDWSQIIFNPALGWCIGTVLVGAALSVAFLMLGLTARQALCRKLSHSEKQVFKTALVIACLSLSFQIPIVVKTWQIAAIYQPAKAAAALSYWNNSDAPNWTLFAWPNEKHRINQFVVNVPYFHPIELSQGLDQFLGMYPPVGAIFWLIRLWIGILLLMGVMTTLGVMQGSRQNFEFSVLSHRYLKIWIAMSFAGGITFVLAWCLILIGQQPYAVYGTITQSEIVASIDSTALLWGLGGYSLLYVCFITAFLKMVFYAACHGVKPIYKIQGQI